MPISPHDDFASDPQQKTKISPDDDFAILCLIQILRLIGSKKQKFHPIDDDFAPDSKFASDP